MEYVGKQLRVKQRRGRGVEKMEARRKDILPEEWIFTVCSEEVDVGFILKFNHQFFADVIILKEMRVQSH